MSIDNKNEPVMVQVSATKLYARENLTRGEFTITRTGPTDSELSVPLTIRGTANNGTDSDLRTPFRTIAPGATAQKGRQK